MCASIKVGDRVEVIESWDGAYTTDPERSGLSNTDNRLRKGEILTVHELMSGDRMSYITAKGYPNVIGRRLVQPTHKFKVGDVVKVVRSDVPRGHFSTIKERYWKIYPDDILSIGEELVVIEHPEGGLGYRNAVKNINRLPTDYVELVTAGPVDTNTTLPKRGDWVKFKTVEDHFYAPSHYFWRSVFDKPARVGDVFRLNNVYESGNVWWGEYKRIGLTPQGFCLNRVEATDPPPSRHLVRKAAAVALIALTGFLSYRFRENQTMRSIIETLGTDPRVQMAIVRLVDFLSYAVMGGVVWYSVTKVAGGFGRWGDRNRRLKKEQGDTLAETIAVAIRNSKV